MGINGLLPVLKSIREQKHVREFARTRVGIDAYGWLHKGAFSCAHKICKGIDTTAYVDYCMHRVRMLIHFGATPVLVFDGAGLPMKSETHAERRTRREEAMKKARDAEVAGNSRAAVEWYQRACGVTPDMARKLIRECRKINVEYIVAPYEADAQLAWMMRTGYVDSVITEDSDLLVYGAEKVFYKMNKNGDGDLYEMKNIASLDSLSMVNFTADMFVYMCVCSGCDFFKGVQGLGLKKSHAIVKRFRTMGRVIQAIRHDRRYSVTKTFSVDFARACLVFRHQTVFDVRRSQHVHLQELDDLAKAKIPPGVLTEAENGSIDLSFLGERRDPTIAKQIAEGYLHPSSLKEYEEPLDLIERPVTLKKKRPALFPEPAKKSPSRANQKPPRRKGFQVQPASSDGSTLFTSTPNLRQRLAGGTRIFNPRYAAAGFASRALTASKTQSSPSASVWAKFRRQERDVSKEDENDFDQEPEKTKNTDEENGRAGENTVSSEDEDEDPTRSGLDTRARRIDEQQPPSKRRKLSKDAVEKISVVNRAVSRFAAPLHNGKGSKFDPNPPISMPPSPDRETYELFEKIDADLSGDVDDVKPPKSTKETNSGSKRQRVSSERRVSRFFPQKSNSALPSVSSSGEKDLRVTRKLSPGGGRLSFRGTSLKTSSLKKIDNFKRGATGKRIVAKRPGK